jgi:hypothetical protein
MRCVTRRLLNLELGRDLQIFSSTWYRPSLLIDLPSLIAILELKWVTHRFWYLLSVLASPFLDSPTPRTLPAPEGAFQQHMQTLEEAFQDISRAPHALQQQDLLDTVRGILLHIAQRLLLQTGSSLKNRSTINASPHLSLNF